MEAPGLGARPSTPVVVDYVDKHKELGEDGEEPLQLRQN